MHIVKRWHCDYCRKTYVEKSVMEKHENDCSYNPASHSCATCENLRSREVVSHISWCMTTVPDCRFGHITEDDCTERNPFGLKRHCPFYVEDKYCDR